MTYRQIYETPPDFDNILLTSDGEFLTRLCFLGSKDATKKCAESAEEKDLPIFRETCHWLDLYFAGQNPDFTPKYKLENSTPFRAEVSDLMRKIPFGKTTTYGDLAKAIAKNRKVEKMSCRAIGGAVGWNPICLIVPCHRVVGAHHNLTGYGGGLKNKIALLKLEQGAAYNFSLPTSPKTATRDKLTRCKWCNENNPLYIEYHDREWCTPDFADRRLLEYLTLESFQAGLSWECVLNKRAEIKKAFDDFDLEKICAYDDQKIAALLKNPKIIRNRRKITAVVSNAKIFREIQTEFGSFRAYLETFTHGETLYETDRTTNDLSDALSKDLNSRGMTFVGSTIIYSYLQAIGVIYSHDRECFLYKSR